MSEWRVGDIVKMPCFTGDYVLYKLEDIWGHRTTLKVIWVSPEDLGGWKVGQLRNVDSSSFSEVNEMLVLALAASGAIDV